MKNLKALLYALHLQATPKSVGAAITGAIIIATAFNVLTPAQAEKVSEGVGLILALVIPDRTIGANPPTSPASEPAPGQ